MSFQLAVRIWAFIALLTWAAHGQEEPSNGAPGWPPAAEVHQYLLEQGLELPQPAEGVTDALDYLQTLAPRVRIASDAADSGNPSDSPALAGVRVFRDDLGYIRVREVRESLERELRDALAQLASSNAARHLVVDLRFASGADFAAAAQAAGHLASRPVAGFRLGEQPLDVSPRSPASSPAVMILVNAGTRGAAEFLAMALRAGARPSLALGTRTAGETWGRRSLETPWGATLVVGHPALGAASAEALPEGGWAPDLVVHVPEDAERKYLEDPMRRPDGSGEDEEAETIRLNEAELVRRRLGLHPPLEALQPRAPQVRDPVLARALDLLEGLEARQAGGDSR